MITFFRYTIILQKRLRVCFRPNLVWILFPLLLLTSCEKPDERFVRLSDDGFSQGGKRFFPVMLNYVGHYYNHGEAISVGPVPYYLLPEHRNSPSKAVIETETKNQLQYIRSLGFNTIRLCIDRIAVNDTTYGYYAGSRFLSMERDYESLLDALRGFISLCAESDLKVMVLIYRPLDEHQVWAYTERMLRLFSQEPAIFSYDFFNEPLYSLEGRDYSKEQAIDISKRWRSLMDEHAPDQLLTVGSSEPIEVFRWDPSMLDVDFLSFHSYNPMRIPNEIYWYSKFSKKPWMIGETSLGAGEDSISNEMQSRFVDEVAQRVVNCGGIGLGWWEYMDLSESPFYEARRSGILTDTGRTQTPAGATVFGVPKPAAGKFSKIDKLNSSGSCSCQDNYFNMVGYRNYRTDFLILDSISGKPIEGAVVRSWNIDYSIGQNTYSNSEGRVTLYSNDKSAQFEIAAPGKNLKKFYAQLSCEPTKEDVAPEDSLLDRKLEYQKISFLDFLVTPADEIRDDFDGKYQIFEFKEDQVQRSSYSCDGGTIYLGNVSSGNTWWNF